MESQQQVPPGIVALASPEDKTKILTFEGDAEMYDHWVSSLLKQRFTIHTISVDGKEWSVDEMVINFKGKPFDPLKIGGFKYNFAEKFWYVLDAKIMKDEYCLEAWIQKWDWPNDPKLPSPSQPKPNYERLEEMLDRSGSQPGELDTVIIQFAEWASLHCYNKFPNNRWLWGYKEKYKRIDIGWLTTEQLLREYRK